MAWTEERIALLKRYWDEGLSASQIAEVMGEGLSRNAVIGKAHRLGLASRPSPLKTSEQREQRQAEQRQGEAKAAPPKAETAAVPTAEPRAATPRPAPKPAPVAAAAPAPEAPPAVAQPAPPPPAARPARPKGGKVTLLDLNDRICKWPIGHPDEADFHFCGKPVNAGFPYCGEHCLVAYQAQMPRRDRPAGPMRPFGPNLPRPR